MMEIDFKQLLLGWLIAFVENIPYLPTTPFKRSYFIFWVFQVQSWKSENSDDLLSQKYIFV